MRFECAACQTVYNISDERLTRPVTKAVCKKCGATMLIRKDAATAQIDPTGDQTTPASEYEDTRPPNELPTVLSMSKQSQAPRDYLAIGVVTLALVILVAAGVFASTEFYKAVWQPLKSITGLLSSSSDSRNGSTGQPAGKKLSQQKRSQKANKYMRAGQKLYNAKRYRKARKEYSRAIKMNPKNASAFFWRGRTFLKTGNHDKAIVDFKKAVSLKPDNRAAYDNLGWLYLMRGEYSQSLRYLNKSIELNPNNGWAYHTRAKIHFTNGDKAQALIDAEKACQNGYEKGCQRLKQYSQ
jgi:tetratricopeptide (TPR) repeat protein